MVLLSACALVSQLYATRFAPLYGGPDDLTRGDAGDAVAAEAEGLGAAEVGWSLEQVATCVVASPREGAPEADAALRAAIAAAAACRHVDTSTLLPPWYDPGMTLVRPLRATARLVLLVPVHLMPWAPGCPPRSS